ncbi:XRE family transcriptional regulator [Streptomyces spinosirectus]|jgi:transcriptional regulator with XRE-family HTH domain|uniref:helix-turn-helix domain-containing protein n=1 Tax=Streptomyces TaxID=1883 RepID=UPI000FFE5201|nr:MULTISPECIES: XRE family transcriptional regulator [Streptomyces]MBY8340062.1 helix-turn-helix domain-containing protein [Streptomyces plumbidurans]UIR19556.1 XRE family transcriptional regulator [Streptomyces spinosirectus]
MTGQAPECARLAEALRELRGRTELSLAALAAKTAYSKSSWERYLNGRKLPPRSAVQALCRVAGVPPARYVALWELAEVAWSGRGARPGPAATEPEPAEAPPEDTPAPPWWRRPVLIAAATAACTLAIVLTVVLRPSDDPRSTPVSGTQSTVRQVLCHGAGCTGRPPLSSGCGDVEVQGVPQVLRTVRRSGVEMQIRYKPECGAAWVRVSGQHVGDRFEVSAPGSAAQRLVIADRYATGILRSSPMVAVRAGNTKAIKACAELAGSGGWECFRP